jgi:hypothetical protein
MPEKTLLMLVKLELKARVERLLTRAGTDREVFESVA